MGAEVAIQPVPWKPLFSPDRERSLETEEIAGGESPPPSPALCLCLQYGAGRAGAAAFRKALCFSHKNQLYGRGEAYTVILHDGLSLPLQHSPSLFPCLSFPLLFLQKNFCDCSRVFECVYTHGCMHTCTCTSVLVWPDSVGLGLSVQRSGDLDPHHYNVTLDGCVLNK